VGLWIVLTLWQDCIASTSLVGCSTLLVGCGDQLVGCSAAQLVGCSIAWRLLKNLQLPAQSIIAQLSLWNALRLRAIASAMPAAAFRWQMCAV
jgi:hypothetical protein